MRRSLTVFRTRALSPLSNNYPAAAAGFATSPTASHTTQRHDSHASQDKHSTSTSTSATAKAGTHKTHKVDDPKHMTDAPPLTEKGQQKELKKAADRKRDENMRAPNKKPAHKDEVVHVASPSNEAGSSEALLNEDLAAEADWRRLATEPDDEGILTHEHDHSDLKSKHPRPSKDSDSSEGM